MVDRKRMGCRVLQFNSLSCFTNVTVADVGQEEDFEAAKKKALKVGAVAVYVEVWLPYQLQGLTSRTSAKNSSRN